MPGRGALWLGVRAAPKPPLPRAGLRSFDRPRKDRPPAEFEWPAEKERDCGRGAEAGVDAGAGFSDDCFGSDGCADETGLIGFMMMLSVVRYFFINSSLLYEFIKFLKLEAMPKAL